MQASGHIQGLAAQATMMASNARVANAMGVSYLIEFIFRFMFYFRQQQTQWLK